MNLVSINIKGIETNNLKNIDVVIKKTLLILLLVLQEVENLHLLMTQYLKLDYMSLTQCMRIWYLNHIFVSNLIQI